jgi:hypothetical protein
MSTQATWLYKKVNIPNLVTIQQELLAVSTTVIKDVDNLTPDFHYIPRTDIENLLPKTQKYLDQLGLLDRWKYLALITGNQGTSLPIHVDTIDWTTRSYGLNIPVLNCASSFTVFYRAEIDRPTQDDPADPRASAFYCKEDTAVEIDRIEAINPCWVNICIPHCPIVNHQLPRILASLRFSPEVHDFLNG